MFHNIELRTVTIWVIVMIVLHGCNLNQQRTENLIHWIDSPTRMESAEPFLLAASDQLLISWVEKINDSTHTTNYSYLTSSGWSEKKEIAKGDNWFVNWADFPAIAKNGSGQILSHFLQKSSAGTYSYDVMYKVTDQEGRFSKEAMLLNNDNTPTEHGFVTTIPDSDSTFLITWLDGRNTVEGSLNRAMNIRSARINGNGTVHNDTLLDDRTCDCCQTSAALTPKGAIIVYRDRSPDEIRDISIVRQVNGKWTEPFSVHKDNWEIKGCPVNGPKVAVHDSIVAVTWFTGAKGEGKVNIAFSSNYGESFHKPVQVNTHSTIGRVDLDFTFNGVAIVSWIESDKNGTFVKIRQISQDGQVYPYIIVSQISESRSSGFPQIEVWEDKVYFAITEVVDGTTNLKTGYLMLDKLPFDKG